MRLPARWFWLIALTALSIVKTGYCYFCDNHATQLPLVLRSHNPELFPGDPFLDALSGYMGWIWWLIAKLSEFVSIEIVFVVLFLLTRALLIYGTARLASDLVPESKTAPFLAALLMALGPYPILGDGTLVEVYWEQSGMFMPLFVLCLALLLEDKPVRFFLLLGVAYLINPLYGSWSLVFFAATYLADPGRGSWRRFAAAAPVFFILAAPILLRGAGVLSEPAVDLDLWMWVNRLLISPHAFPETWPSVQFRHFFLFSGLVLLAGLLFRGIGSRLWRLTVIWTILAWIFLALAFPAAAGVSRTLLIFQPARAAELFYLAGGVTAAGVGAYLAEKWRGGVGFLALVLIFSSLAYLLVPEFREHVAPTAIIAGGILACGLLLADWKSAAAKRWFPVVGCLWLGLVVSLTIWASLGARVERDGGIAQAMYRGPDPAVQELADWARISTPIDSVFFHDPITWKWAQFRYLAQRPVFTTWKDASAVLWDPSFAGEWSRRFAAYGFRGKWRDRWDLSQPGEVRRVRRSLVWRYQDLSDEDLDAMSQEYRIDFWIAPIATLTKFPAVHTSGNFKVLDLRERS